MKEDFKKWLESLAETTFGCLCPACTQEKQVECKDCSKYLDLDEDIKMLVILTKAMWAINQNSKWNIQIDNVKVYISGFKENSGEFKYLFYNEHDDSEQQALEKALEYIYEKDKP